MSRWQLLRISTVNLLVVAIVLFLLWGNQPLEEQMKRLHVGMTVTEVEKVLGSRSHKHNLGFFSFDRSLSGDARVHWRSPVSAARVGFSIPREINMKPGLDLGHIHFWIEPKQCLLVVFGASGKLEHILLLPLSIEPVAWSEWFKYQYEYWYTRL